MMSMRAQRFLAVLLVATVAAMNAEVKAQYLEPQPSDYYARTMTWDQFPQKPEFVRENDVYWSKILWGIIDVREKENQYFYFPIQPEGLRGRKNLAYVLWDAIKAGEIEIFLDDELKVPLDNEVIVARATRIDTLQMEVFDDYGDAEYETILMPHEFTSDDIFQYAIKQVVYMDRARSGMQIRRIALAPVEERYMDIAGEKEYMGAKPLFWVPMNAWSVRVLFAKKEAYCRENLVHLPNWEYAFNRNMYTWFITREDNVYNRAITDYLTGEDALLEAQRIEEEILNISLDMWEY